MRLPLNGGKREGIHVIHYSVNLFLIDVGVALPVKSGMTRLSHEELHRRTVQHLHAKESVAQFMPTVFKSDEDATPPKPSTDTPQ